LGRLVLGLGKKGQLHQVSRRKKSRKGAPKKSIKNPATLAGKKEVGVQGDVTGKAEKEHQNKGTDKDRRDQLHPRRHAQQKGRGGLVKKKQPRI